MPATAITLVLLVGGCASSETTSCESPGKVYENKIPVVRADSATDGPLETVSVYLVCGDDKTMSIVDSNGDGYKSLEEFQADNEIFEVGDEILISKDFPAVEQSAEDAEYVTVPGRVSNAWVWWLTGGAVVALALGAFIARRWLTRRRYFRDA